MADVDPVERRDDVLGKLHAASAELRSKHNLKSLFLFGSVARGEARPESDVDILVEFNGWSTVKRIMELADDLEALLGGKVDLLTMGAVRPRLMEAIRPELVRAA